MADNSKFVLRWEIDNAAATLATGKVESGVFNEGGFRWIAALESRKEGLRFAHNQQAVDTIDFMLRCDSGHNGPWMCEGGVEVYGLAPNGCYLIFIEHPFITNNNSCTSVYSSVLLWDSLDWGFKIKDKVTMEFRINIIRSERGAPITNASLVGGPHNMSNVILKIGDKALHVSKEFLAIHSPVFEALFFGNSAEKGKKEVELEDVVFEEFLDLLHLLYMVTVITDRTAQHILKLAYQFQMKRVINLSVKHLTQSKGIDVMKKLMLADQYRLTSLKDHCLQSFASDTDLTAMLKSSPDYSNFSAGLKADICDKIVELKLQ